MTFLKDKSTEKAESNKSTYDFPIRHARAATTEKPNTWIVAYGCNAMPRPFVYYATALH